ncbi:MAG TPA: helix-turn-helix transcriptional regulator [Puia sp.]|nr:helix-turn-helix transcriptional regulator [Puia sp.]
MEQQFSQLASLIGEPARAKMLWNLLDGRAFTATELALMADVSPQSASMHLNKLLQAQLLTVEHQGRHRYYALASREVAYAIEAMASLLPVGQPGGGSIDGQPAGGTKIALGSKGTGEARSGNTESVVRNGDIKYCRSCYDHLAGKIGVAITDKLVAKQLLIPETNRAAGYTLTPTGLVWFTRLGIDIDALKSQRRTFTRQCLDWSERRPHIAGSLGAALLEKMQQEDWVRTIKNSRALLLTGKGEKKLQELLGLTL